MNRSIRTVLAVLATLALALSLGACGGGGEEQKPAAGGDQKAGGPEQAAAKQIKPVAGAEGKSFTVGSKNFTEQFVLGEIYAQALEAAGFTVKRQLNLGSEQIAFKALQSGQIDGYPEYTGTALTSFFGLKTDDVPKDAARAYELAKAEYAKKDISALPRTPFENTYRLGMTKQKYDQLGIQSTSELEGKDQDLVISGFAECRQRTDCLLGVERAYGLKFKKFLASEAPYEVLENGQADVAFLFSTDARLALTEKFRTLEDDKRLFPPYNITFSVRSDGLKKIGPEGQKVMEAVQKPLDEEVMRELNSRVDLDKKKPEDVARAYLKEAGFTK